MDLGSLVAAPAGIAFGAVSRLRRARSLHPRGWLADATLVIDGTAATGVPLLDDASRLGVLVRLSKSAGLPGASPDVLGLALRIPVAEGDVDLLLATTGMSPGLRHLFLPGRDWASAYSTAVPFETSRGLLLLGLVPRSRVFAPPSLRALEQRLGGRDLDFDVVVATPEAPGARSVRSRSAARCEVTTMPCDSTPSPPPRAPTCGLRSGPCAGAPTAAPARDGRARQPPVGRARSGQPPSRSG